MTGHFYRIAKRVRSTGAGVTDSYYVELSAVAKTNGANAPYCIPNEFICGEIGRFLGLPIPPVGLMAFTGAAAAAVAAPALGPPPTGGAAIPGAGAAPGARAAPGVPVTSVWFASLDFNFTGVNLPPVDPGRCAADLPGLSTGLILFDVLVANSDRHRGNLALDTSVTPPRMSIFDHSHALLGSQAGGGAQRLLDLRDRLGISRGAVTAGNRQCLLDNLNTGVHLQGWVAKIKVIPDFFIDDVCTKVENLGASADEILAVKNFLKYRRTNIATILNSHQAEFTAIGHWETLT